MDNKEEYHDPDYPEVSACVKEEPPSEPEEDKLEKTKEIIRREFSNEIDIRENEVMLIDQRMTTSRRLLHRLRYTIVSSYYNDLKLQMTNGQIQDEIADQRDPRSKAEISSLLREGQRNIHPSLKKLLGKKTVDLSEIFKLRAPRNKVRKDYSAMLQKRNYTISADSTKSLRPGMKDIPEEEPCGSQLKKVPRHIEPKNTNVMTLDESTRNQMKHRYRIVIGNTSKYAPGASSADRSTHKWLLYIRGPPAAPDISRVVRAVSVRLHHSYAPHHTVLLHKPPFHVSRRGWGEFPARIELQFALPHRNRPAQVHHTIRLDTDCTGLQTLGAETLLDVWLYSTPEMLEYEYKETATPHIQPPASDHPSAPEQQLMPLLMQPKLEPEEPEPESDSQADNWLDFFSKEPKELDVDEMIIKPEKKKEEKTDLDSLIQSNVITKCKEESQWQIEDELPKEILNQPIPALKRIVKYIEPSTGKIYYLEMDRNLDLSKVQEIIVNNTTAKVSPTKLNGLKKFRKRKGMSLLKPELKSLLKPEVTQKIEIQQNFSHIENDHCYLASRIPQVSEEASTSSVEVKMEESLYGHLCSVVQRFDSVRAGVNYMLKKIPVISDDARDPDYLKRFPFTVESYERYWKMDFAKRRNIEWSRAKLINTLLSEYFTHCEPVWRTKQILMYARIHGHYPVRNELITSRTEDHWSSWQSMDSARRIESNIKEYYPSSSNINTLSLFRREDFVESFPEVYNLVDSDDEVDVEGVRPPVRVKKESVDEGTLTVMPVEDEEERLRFLFLEKKCADIGIELKCEDVGNGCYYSAAHSVMLSAVRSFAAELVRSALAQKQALDSSSGAVWTGSSSSRPVVGLEHVLMAAASDPRLQALSARDTGTDHKQTHHL